MFFAAKPYILSPKPLHSAGSYRGCVDYVAEGWGCYGFEGFGSLTCCRAEVLQLYVLQLGCAVRGSRPTYLQII